MANRYKSERKSTLAKARGLRRKDRKLLSVDVSVLSDARQQSEENARISVAVQPAPLRWPGFTGLFAAAILTVLVCRVYGFIAWRMFNGASDSKAHLWFAQQLNETNSIVAPDFLFQAFVVGLIRSGRVHSFPVSGLLVLLGAFALTAIAIYLLLDSVFPIRPRFGAAPIVFLVAAAAVLAEPLVHPSTYGIGYFWPTTYDNPTSTLTKPFSLIAFALTAWFLAKKGRRGYWFWAPFALATAAAILSKPSFIICLVPAAGLIALIRLIRKESMSLVSLIMGLFAPAAIVLGWAYYETYSGNSGKVAYHDSIIWAPLMVMRYHATNLTLKFFLSVAFPLSLLGLYWNRAKRDVTLVLAWLSFLFAALYGYMLAEKLRAYAGNFLWSGYIAAFILFVASIMFWLRELSETIKSGRVPMKFWVCTAILALHVLSGAMVTWNYYKATA